MTEKWQTMITQGEKGQNEDFADSDEEETNAFIQELEEQKQKWLTERKIKTFCSQDGMAELKSAAQQHAKAVSTKSFRSTLAQDWGTRKNQEGLLRSQDPLCAEACLRMLL